MSTAPSPPDQSSFKGSVGVSRKTAKAPGAIRDTHLRWQHGASQSQNRPDIPPVLANSHRARQDPAHFENERQTEWVPETLSHPFRFLDRTIPDYKLLALTVKI